MDSLSRFLAEEIERLIGKQDPTPLPTQIIENLYRELGFPSPTFLKVESPMALQQAVNHGYGYQTDLIPLKNIPEKGFLKQTSSLSEQVWKWFGQHARNAAKQSLLVFSEVSLERITHKVRDEYEWILSSEVERITTEHIKTEFSGSPGLFFSPNNDLKFSQRAYQARIRWMLQEKPELKLAFEPLLPFLNHGIFWSFAYQDYFLYCPEPSYIELDELNRIHGESSAALAWKDEFQVFGWHSVNVSRELILHPESVTRETILNEKNAEIRRCIQERIGSERYGELLGLIELDKDEDLRGNLQVLYRTQEKDDIANDYLYFAKVACPSTGRIYFLGVPPRLTNVWDAVAWTFGKDKESYRPIIET